ncbi:hypothetical protein N2152v2_006931 [Parachlorella kessleri]
MLLLSEPTVAGINTKTPKQILVEFYDLYRDAQDPTFQVYAVPGPTPGAPPAMFKATVLCPAIYRAPGDKAFEDLMFEGVGKTKKLAEHDCADKAYTFIRTLPGLKLPSGALSLGAAATATNGGTAAAAMTPQLGPGPAAPLSPATPAALNHPAYSASHLAGAGPAAPPSLLTRAVPPAAFAHPASSAAPLAGAGPAVATPAAPKGPGAGLELSINEALLESMTHEEAKAMLREAKSGYCQEGVACLVTLPQALRLFKGLVEAVHAEKQRHFEELDRLIMGHL